MPDSPLWISVSDAAARLGIGARAVQQRAERGTITARRVKYGRALRWEIDGRELDESARAKRSPDVRNERGEVRETFATRSQDVRAEPRPTDGDLNARLLAQLESENSFLRATIEQLQRDGAETRAALRAALKLTAETSAPQLTPGTSAPDVASDATATPEPQSAQIHTPDPTTAKQSSGRPLTYSDIADELERLEKERQK